MAELRVWAPRARHQVEVELGDGARRVPMAPIGAGWHAATIAAIGPDHDYGFVVDGRGPYPDPRSPFQPHGVHGLSRLVDHDAFQWNDSDWTGADPRDGVIYELHVGTFSPRGDFDGVIERLDHLVELGVTTVEVMPVCEFSGERNWGYDGVDLYAPHHAYGGPDGFKRLVDACHRRGLAVALDVVYNHVGPEGNYLGIFAPYFTDFYSTPWGEAINYDQANSDEVRRFVIDNALMWLRDYHVDALRLDAVHAIIDTSAVHVLEQMAMEVDSLSSDLGRPLTLIAESDQNDPRLCRPRERGGFGLHAQWSDDFHHALHVALTGEASGYYSDFTEVPDAGTTVDGETASTGGGAGTVAALGRAVENGWVFTGEYSGSRQRRHGRPPHDLHGSNLLAYSQNHDQVGNRAVGDRLSSMIGPGRQRIAAALVLTSPFVPMLFQGEEWASDGPFQYFTDHQDRELGRAVAQGRRSEFGAFGWEPDQVPDPQDPATFERSRLDWAELAEPPHDEMLEWYRSLIALRATEPDLAVGPLGGPVEVGLDESWLRIDRRRFAVVVNLGFDQPVPCPTGAVVLASDPTIDAPGDGGSIHMPADSVVIVKLGTEQS